MKFSLKNINNAKSLREGIITNISRLPDIELETPLLLFYTKGGSIPHISREVLEFLTQDQIAIQVPLPSTVQCFEGTKGYGKGISKFVGLEEMATYCSVQDPAVKTPGGYNSKAQISVWSHTGRVPLSVEKYMDIMEAFQPDFYQALANGDTEFDSSKKKVNKVMESTLHLIDACLDKHKKSSILQSRAIFGSVEGGYNLELRQISAESVAKKDVDGFVINGLHNNGPEVENIDFEKVRPVLDIVLKYLPEEKPRIIHGCWKPENILKMIEMGVDIFDTSLPYVVAERKSALVFKYSETSENLDVSKDANYENAFEICLADSKFKEDLTPILDTCSCLTCRKHTRAYINHLEENKELLARTLLIMHNLHHYSEFFKAIRDAASRGKRICIL